MMYVGMRWWTWQSLDRWRLLVFKQLILDTAPFLKVILTRRLTNGVSLSTNSYFFTYILKSFDINIENTFISISHHYREFSQISSKQSRWRLRGFRDKNINITRRFFYILMQKLFFSFLAFKRKPNGAMSILPKPEEILKGKIP